jgi:hypothetical protein
MTQHRCIGIVVFDEQSVELGRHKPAVGWSGILTSKHERKASPFEQGRARVRFLEEKP